MNRRRGLRAIPTVIFFVAFFLSPAARAQEGSGLRLFDYSLSMRSLDHNGLLFDNLTFSNFGYGGDPNDVTRLRVEKNKWYDFRLLFRRAKNFWDSNLYPTPLDPPPLNPPGSLSTGCFVGPPT